MEDKEHRTETIKMMRINLLTDSLEVVGEARAEAPKRASRWLRNLAISGCVHEDDLERYLTFTEIRGLRERFAEGGREQSITYRSCEGGEFCRASMTLTAGSGYSDECPEVLMVIRSTKEEETEKVLT